MTLADITVPSSRDHRAYIIPQDSLSLSKQQSSPSAVRQKHNWFVSLPLMSYGRHNM